jgi:hypothetical protein
MGLAKDKIFSDAKFDPEDGDSMDLKNYGILPQHYTTSQPSEDGGSMDL